jgi:hypothetical protein
MKIMKILQTSRPKASVAPNQQRSPSGRFLREPPPELFQLLKVINMFPRDVSLYEFEDALRLAKYQAPGADSVDVGMAALDICFSRISEEDGRQELRDYILRRTPETFEPHKDMEDAAYCYEHFRIARLRLVGLARLNSLLEPLREKSVELGEARLVSNLLGEPTTGVEAARIRECKVCERIYWAGRLDAWQCGSRKCKSQLSTKLWRERKEQYQQARMKKRAKAKSAKLTTAGATGRKASLAKKGK